MNLVPGWAPNIHPVLVHFPLALLGTAIALDLVGWAVRCNKPLRDVATVLYVVGFGTALAVYFTGRAASQTVWIPGMAHAVVKDHWDWAFRTVWFFGVATLARLALLRRPDPSGGLVAALALAGLVGLGLLVATGDRGGRLVYQFGVGVSTE
jgi:uncharacterized membrane protein